MAGDKQNTVLRPKGTIIITPEIGPEVHIDCKQCCHCGCVIPILKGSGRRRGFCMHCMDITCGAHKCDTCNPLQLQLERIEKGLPPV